MPDGSPRPSPLARVPPNSLRAEESVLGAMLLSREAIAEVVEILEPEHFYKPAHGHLYEAILSLYSSGEPVDAVTVADELKRAGMLDEVGGPAVLLDFQATTPAISNAHHYAKIVEEHALLRRMISVSNEIAEMAYSVPEDVLQAVDDAEAKMFDVAQRRVTNTTAAIRDLLPANLDRIEMLYDRGEAITGMSSGYLDLDEKLAGLQPNALYVIGARPAMGKALALDTPLATPDGWTTMGEVRAGDEVFDERGTPCTVTYKSPVFEGHDCYEVVFDDGSTIVADADHLWETWDHRAWKSKREAEAPAARGPVPNPRYARDQTRKRTWPAVRSTREIAASLRVGNDQRPNHRIEVAGPLDLPEAELPLDPYLLGLWLGDGHTGRPQITTMDREIVAAFEADGWTLVEAQPAGRATTYVIHHALDDESGLAVVQVGGRPMLRFTRVLRDIGLWASRPTGEPGTVSKHIPGSYLRASEKQRLALLQGLMDTDGCVVKGQTTCQIALSHRVLIEQVRELALSLGIKAGPLKHKRSNYGTDVWTMNFSAYVPVFRLRRKAEAQRVVDRPNSTPRWRTIVDARPVPSVPTQCITVDSPSHLYLAGREMIATHNTAFALGMACNSAMKDRKPVLIFTLEMSQLELSQRLLCSEALVDSGKVKTGRLEEAEWTRISHAVGRLAEAPIYIDDNPHTSIMDIRAKARRLKSREGDLGMIVIDYIQLMSGRSNAESRQVEVSEISRNLKILARELEAPVIALAQLNRSLEQRTDKRPMLSDLRESGCLTGSTKILRADTGREATIDSLMESGDLPVVWALDDRQRVVPAQVSRVFSTGVKPVFRLRLASGRQVEATANHRFLTIEGWKRLDELPVGEYLATPRILPEPILGEAVWSPVYNGTTQMLLPCPYRLTHGRYHPVRTWLEPHGLWLSRSGTKFIPPSVFSQPNADLAHFLHHLWATDGSLSINRRAAGPPVRCYYATNSGRLADDVQHALGRLGIRTAIGRTLKSRPDGSHYPVSYHVRVQGADNQLAFLDLVGCHGARGDLVPEARTILEQVKGNPNNDLVPWPIAAQVKDAMVTTGLSHRQLTAGLGEQYCGSYLLGSHTRQRRLSRERLERMGRLTDSPRLVAVATSDIYWDEIVSIEPAGEEETFDLTVPGPHNFVANGIIAHNSLEQDADVVLFLYRDEVYDEASPDKGVAEVIVAKHRNGPTGRVRLAFRGQYTRFDNMARTAPPKGGGPDEF